MQSTFHFEHHGKENNEHAGVMFLYYAKNFREYIPGTVSKY